MTEKKTPQQPGTPGRGGKQTDEAIHDRQMIEARFRDMQATFRQRAMVLFKLIVTAIVVTQANRALPILISTVVPTHSATAAACSVAPKTSIRAAGANDLTSTVSPAPRRRPSGRSASRCTSLLAASAARWW